MSSSQPRLPAHSRRKTRIDRTKGVSLAALVAAADAVVSELLSGTPSPERARTLGREPALQVGLDPDATIRGVYTLAARDPRLLSGEPAAALKAQLAMLLLFAPITHASVWSVDADREDCVARAGSRFASQHLRRIARRSVEEDARRGSVGGQVVHAVPVIRWDRAWGALIVDAKRGRVSRALGYAGEAAGAISPILERQLLLGQALGSAEQVLLAADRRVARLGFDIHDGPLQALSLLLAELSAFERQTETLVPDKNVRRLVECRLADLMALAVELAADLRELATTGHAGYLSLREALEQTVTSFHRRTAVEVELSLTGDVERTTRSQRIVVARVVEEALANVREHSHARHASVEVVRDGGRLELRIVDDGRGFSTARVRRRAARDRRLGLTVMAERVRLLGGRLEIQSRRGGPTLVSASLPAWDSADVPQQPAQAEPSLKLA